MTPSYAHGTCATPLLGETIGENLRRTAARVPYAEALVVRHQGFRATYHELWELTGRAARGLLARGVAAGDRVGIWAPNRAEWVVAQFATARIGAILVNINPAYRAAELEFALTKSGVSVLLLAHGFRGTDYRRMLTGVRPGCPDLCDTLVLDDDWPALLAAGDGVPEDELAARERGLQFDDPINIQ
ncbi:MAG: AMP-binding protein, partial [Gemmataceae bacterium]